MHSLNNCEETNIQSLLGNFVEIHKGNEKSLGCRENQKIYVLSGLIPSGPTLIPVERLSNKKNYELAVHSDPLHYFS